jgi:hypothetical protein
MTPQYAGTLRPECDARGRSTLTAALPRSRSESSAAEATAKASTSAPQKNSAQPKAARRLCRAFKKSCGRSSQRDAAETHAAQNLVNKVRLEAAKRLF